LRKMRGQLLRYRLNPLDHAACEISRPEIGFHLLADLLPTGSADFDVDAAIGDDLDVPVRQQQINQHSIVVRGVPYPQMRENVERALPRRLIAEQRLAIQRAFHDEADLAGMGGLSRLDCPLDCSQHLRRENPPYPPTMLNKMFADAPDAHIFTSYAYQLPDAPPPQKLPQPPLIPQLDPQLTAKQRGASGPPTSDLAI